MRDSEQCETAAARSYSSSSTTTLCENVWYESELRAEDDEETPTYAMRVVPTFDDVGECAEGVEVL